MTVVWPRHILTPQDPLFAMTPMSLHGPISGTNISDVMQGDAPYWRVTFGNIVVNTDLKVRVFKGISAILDGMSTPIILPYCRRFQPILAGANFSGSLPHSDGADFADGVGYAHSATDVRINGAVAKRKVDAVVDVLTAARLEPGHVFSIRERLYELRKVDYIAPKRAVIKFRPPLREAVVDGATLNFDDPKVRVRLLNDTQMDLTLTMNRRARPTVEFVEDLIS